MQEEVPSPALSATGGLRNLSGENLAGVPQARELKESVLMIILVAITPNAVSVSAQGESVEATASSIMASQKLGKCGCHWVRDVLCPRNGARVMGHGGIEGTPPLNIGPLLISP